MRVNRVIIERRQCGDNEVDHRQAGREEEDELKIEEDRMQRELVVFCELDKDDDEKGDEE